MAAFRTDSRADLGSGRLIVGFALLLEELGLSFFTRSDVASLRFSDPSRMKSLSSSRLGVGIGGPRPPAGNGVSTHAPVTKGVLRVTLGIDGRGLSSAIVLSIQPPVMCGVRSLVFGFEGIGVSSACT